MADNRVVIKINYDKSKTAKPAIEPQTITVWHTGRIVIALVLLVLFLLFLYFMFSRADQAGNTQTEPAAKVQEPESNPDSAAIVPERPAAEAKDINNKVDAKAVPPSPDNTKAGLQASSPVAIIFDRRVIRASLNTRLKDNEPDQPVQGAFAVVKGKPLELFYFTEIRNLGGQVLFHEWLRNKQVVQHKQLELKDMRFKGWSSRILSYKDVGEWQVRLSDKKGKVYSEVKFLLSAE